MTEERRRTPPSWRWRTFGRRASDYTMSALAHLEHLTGQSRFGAQLRNLWLFVITVLVLLALSSQQSEVQSQIRGRHFAVGVMCAAVSATAEAGRQVIIGGTGVVQGPFERALERLGYPPRAVRRREAQVAARLYVQHIVLHVAQQVGVKPSRLLVSANGALNCARLQRLALTGQ